MKQRSINSHFKIKKNKPSETIFSSNEKGGDLLTSEKNMNRLSEDPMKLVIQSSGKPYRAKRVPRDSEPSFEEPEVKGKRVQLEKKKGKLDKISHEGNKINDILQSLKKNSNGKNNSNKKQKDEEVISSCEKIKDIVHGSNNLATKEKKKSPIKEEDVIMSDVNFKEYQGLIAKDKSSESKSTANTLTNSPKPMDLSNKTKNIIQSILKKKTEIESGKKITDSFNYLNYSSAILKTPVKSPNTSLSQNLFGLSSNNNNMNSYQKINNNFSINNSSIKDASPLNITTNSKPAELKLSQKTLDVINQIKSERKNRFERDSLNLKSGERVRSESSFSLKFKYEDLIKEERELILPPHYKKLLQSFTELDLTLNFYKLSSRRNHVPIFEEIQQSIESSYKHKFDFKTFAQILYVTPHLYVYKWQKMNLNSDDFSLIVEIPKDHQKRLRTENLYDSTTDLIKMQTENYDPAIEAMTNAELEERKKVFKNALIAITNDYHEKFLESIDFTKDYDPIKLKTWHHEFDLEKVPPITIFEILEKPTIKITSIEEFLHNNNIKNSLIKRAIEDISNDNNEELRNSVIHQNPSENGSSQATSSLTNNDPNLNSLSKYLPASLLKKIVAKEEAVTISHEYMQYSSHKIREKTKARDYQSFVDKMKTIFIMNNSPSISLQDLIRKMNNSGNLMNWAFSEGNV